MRYTRSPMNLLHALEWLIAAFLRDMSLSADRETQEEALSGSFWRACVPERGSVRSLWRFIFHPETAWSFCCQMTQAVPQSGSIQRQQCVQSSVWFSVLLFASVGYISGWNLVFGLVRNEKTTSKLKNQKLKPHHLAMSPPIFSKLFDTVIFLLKTASQFSVERPTLLF